MTMISYAQNAEDVLLRRLFPDDYVGFYVDVGANDPIENSVTRHFSERGWRGVNVEPGRAMFDRLVIDRPRDVNLHTALSNREGVLPFFEIQPHGSLSTLDEETARRHADAGYSVTRREMPVTTLGAVLERHAPATVDFVSIDVEAHEREVLEGVDWTRHRPRVVIVEATRPNQRAPAHEQWEPILLGQGYLFATFDGLNRFYVREEDRSLADRLAVPANVFDDFIPWLYAKRIRELEQSLAETGLQLAAAETLLGSAGLIGKARLRLRRAGRAAARLFASL
jgi:FkbM family methyltransferase